MSKQLSERETAVLRLIEKHSAHADGGATGDDLEHGLRELVATPTAAGAHQTAASLCRKGLAWRAGTSKLQWYRITQHGRHALKGEGGQWVARRETPA